MTHRMHFSLGRLHVIPLQRSTRSTAMVLSAGLEDGGGGATSETSMEHDIAALGNGHNEELSDEELKKIQELFDRVAPMREELIAEHASESDVWDHEACRRYLVAREWDLDKAEAQLVSTLEWRKTEDHPSMEFWESRKALADPHSLNMRVVGNDKEGRPIVYTCFAEARDRWDNEANINHLTLLMDACDGVIRKRRAKGLNPTAASRQTVYVVDFDGFGLRDQDPRMSVMTAKLLQYYPETMGLAVFLDAPTVFYGLFRLVKPLLDERVRSKIVFVNKKGCQDTLEEHLGEEAAEWLLKEMQDNKNKRPDAKSGNPKKYWKKVSAEHDPRGMPTYLDSEFYVKTPGDAHEEIKEEKS